MRNAALVVSRAVIIRPDGSGDLEQIAAFDHSFDANNARTQVGTPVATAFPTMRKLTGNSF